MLNSKNTLEDLTMALWHAYEIAPIDFRWTLLKTVEQTARELGAEAAVNASNGHNNMEEFGIDEFLASWEDAKDAAHDQGWQGDFTNKPVVFWVPVEDKFECGFVIKQNNNGTTYVVSPIELPHYARLK